MQKAWLNESNVVNSRVATGEKETSSFFSRISDAINSKSPHSALDEDADVRTMHDNAEVFDARTEGVFRYLQVPHITPNSTMLLKLKSAT
jgi:hypothetical protein